MPKLVGQLIHPDAVRNRCFAATRSSLVSGFCSRRSRSAQIPAGVDEALECIFVVEDKDQPKFLHSKTKPRLQLNSLHEGLTLALVIDGDALPPARTGNENLHTHIANNRLSSRPLDCCFDLWIGFIEC